MDYANGNEYTLARLRFFLRNASEACNDRKYFARYCTERNEKKGEKQRSTGRSRANDPQKRTTRSKASGGKKKERGTEKAWRFFSYLKTGIPGGLIARAFECRPFGEAEDIASVTARTSPADSDAFVKRAGGKAPLIRRVRARTRTCF